MKSFVTDADTAFWDDSIVIGMICCGFGGALILFLIICHVLWHFSHDRIKVTGWVRYVNLFTFFESMCACLAYALLKVDVLLPVGTKIPCSLGYIIPLLLVGFAKTFTFILFTLRIHTTFSGSSFAFSRKKLMGGAIFYLFLSIGFAAALVFFAIEIVEYKITPGGIGVCSIFEGSLQFRATLAITGLVDAIMSSILVYIFVSKLRQVMCTPLLTCGMVWRCVSVCGCEDNGTIFFLFTIFENVFGITFLFLCLFWLSSQDSVGVVCLFFLFYKT